MPIQGNNSLLRKKRAPIRNVHQVKTIRNQSQGRATQLLPCWCKVMAMTLTIVGLRSTSPEKIKVWPNKAQVITNRNLNQGMVSELMVPHKISMAKIWHMTTMSSSRWWCRRAEILTRARWCICNRTIMVGHKVKRESLHNRMQAKVKVSEIIRLDRIRVSLAWVLRAPPHSLIMAVSNR